METELQPREGPSINTKLNAARLTTLSAWDDIDNRTARPEIGTIYIWVSIAPSNPNGTLIQKTLRQPKKWIKIPPTSGPTEAATPTRADQIPSMVARTPLSSYRCVSKLSELGMNSAAPTP